VEKSLARYWPLFVIPTFAAFIIGFIVPFGMGIWLSFNEFTTVTNTTFVGLKNFTRVFAEPDFLYSLGFTTLFAVVSLVIINVCAFALALALTWKLRGTNAFRTVFFMPNLIGGIVLGNIFQLIINGVLSLSGLLPLNLVASYGFWGLIILVSWQQIGYMMIIYIAGLQTIPGEMKEAADIDGANWWMRLTRVTIPMCMPAITICTFLSVVNGFKLFDQNLALTAGEPIVRISGEQVRQSEMLALNIYHTFYSRIGFEGLAQAKAVLFFILVVSIGLVQLFLTRRKEVQY
jgi:raffinose/stachyose/melibiose transport system permease protein